MSFQETQFRQKVEQAVAKVKTLLENSRQPQYPADVAHQYVDKFLLAERLGLVSVKALHTLLTLISGDHASENTPAKAEWLDQVKVWEASGASVTLRFSSEQRCKFMKTAKRRESTTTGSSTTVAHSSTWLSGRSSTDVTRTSFVEIEEWFWLLEHSYSITAYPGNRLSEAAELVARDTSVELVTRTKASPKSEVNVFQPIDLEITPLVKLLGPENEGVFSIDRASASCWTPRRNTQVDALYVFMSRFLGWSTSVKNYFTNSVFPVQPPHALNLSSMDAAEAGVFVPVVPLFEEGGSTPDTRTAPMLSLSDVAAMMQEQERGLGEKLSELRKTFGSAAGLITIHEASLCLLLQHTRTIAVALRDGVDFVEDMLRKQVVAAIGKEVTAQDVAEYMRFHNRKLFAPGVMPRPWHFDVRRGAGHAPEGSVSIECSNPSNSAARSPAEGPITTSVRVLHGSDSPPMKFALNAATDVSFEGPHYLHGYIQHKFSGEPVMSHSLVARARQFSSFVLMVGRIAGADLFEPMHAIIVKDKDEVILPLLMDPLPTPKEFKDAIESLSPEQQRFAKAFRAMQLESTLFGVLVVQIKPQMEALLRLPEGSLTKEIQLTQDLMELFIKYQVPSDLLYYDGRDDAAVEGKVAAVKGHVQALQAMIAAQKEKELEEQREVAAAAVLDRVEGCALDAAECFGATGLDCIAFSSCSASLEPPGEMVPDIPQPSSRSSSAARKPSLLLGKGKSMMAKGLGGSIGAGYGGGGGGGRGGPRKALRSAPPRPPAPASAPAMSLPRDGMLQLQQDPWLADNPEGPPVDQTVMRERDVRQEAAEPSPEEAERSPDGGAETGLFGAEADASAVAQLDYTRVPRQLDSAFEALDADSSLRPTTITVSKAWTRSSAKGLLRTAAKKQLTAEEQTTEKSSAMDLVDALSRSGDLPLNTTQLHIVLAATHCFDTTVMDTLVTKNVNPIERIERSALIVAQTIHGTSCSSLLANEAARLRVQAFSPQLLLLEESQQQSEEEQL
ncbi:unnamed protein product [Chrysoparadoxa australica]